VRFTSPKLNEQSISGLYHGQYLRRSGDYLRNPGSNWVPPLVRAGDSARIPGENPHVHRSSCPESREKGKLCFTASPSRSLICMPVY